MKESRTTFADTGLSAEEISLLQAYEEEIGLSIEVSRDSWKKAQELNATYIDSINQHTPEGFSYADDIEGFGYEDYESSHQHLYQPGPDRVFARSYGAKNEFEHGATDMENIFAGEGLVLEGDASWGSMYHQNQVSWLVCMETVAPGTLNFVIAHDAARKGIHADQAHEHYTSYIESNLESLYRSLSS